MKRIFTSVLLVALALGLMAFQSAGPAQDSSCSSVVMGDSCVLRSDETLQSGMVVMGGSVVLEEGSTIKGDVVVFGGNVTADGTIDGDLSLIGGNANLGGHAHVTGDVNTVGGNLNRQAGAEIGGSSNRNVPAPFNVPGGGETPNWNNGSNSGSPDWSSPFASGLNMIGSFFWWLARSFLWAVLALILVLLAPRNVERMSVEANARPVEAGGLGCLTVIIVPLLLAVLAITICGIPVTVVGALLLVVAWGVGVIVMGYELGKRLVHMLKQDWAPAVQAALGTAVLTLAFNGIRIIPCIGVIGWLAAVVVGSVGLGVVLLTRFGTQNTLGGTPGSGPLYPAPSTSYGAYGAPIDTTPAPAYPGVPPTQVIDHVGGADRPSDDDLPPTVGIYDPDAPNDPSM